MAIEEVDLQDGRVDPLDEGRRSLEHEVLGRRGVDRQAPFSETLDDSRVAVVLRAERFVVTPRMAGREVHQGDPPALDCRGVEPPHIFASPVARRGFAGDQDAVVGLRPADSLHPSLVRQTVFFVVKGPRIPPDRRHGLVVGAGVGHLRAGFTILELLEARCPMPFGSAGGIAPAPDPGDVIGGRLGAQLERTVADPHCCLKTGGHPNIDSCRHDSCNRHHGSFSHLGWSSRRPMSRDRPNISSVPIPV